MAGETRVRARTVRRGRLLSAAEQVGVLAVVVATALPVLRRLLGRP